MKITKTNGRILGLMLLLLIVIGITVKQFLLGSSTFNTQFLTTAAANATNTINSALIGIFSSVLGFCFAILLFEIFKPFNKLIAVFYLAFSIADFAVSIFENIAVFSLVSLSQKLSISSPATTTNLLIYGEQLQLNYLWIHLTNLLISAIPLLLMYLAFYNSKLVPKPISIIGMIASILMGTAMILSLHNNGHTNMYLLMPLGISQILLALWLMIKGFNAQDT